jgi:hypothetical protein
VIAQQVPVGQWQSHFSYNTARSIELVNDKIFTAGVHLYVYSLSDQDYTIYSKVNGLSDVNIQFIRYDAATDYLLMVYENGNIDLMRDNQFYNIPDIKNLNITGSKRINGVYFKHQLMYLCTDFGIVVLNPTRMEIKESYVLQQNGALIQIKGLTTYDGKFLAATSAGIFTADETNPALQNFASWTLRTDTAVQYIMLHQGQLYAASDQTLYKLTSTALQPIYTSQAPITQIRQGSTDFYVCERNANRRGILIFDALGQLRDSVKNINPNDVVETNPNEIWEADLWEGLVRLQNRSEKSLFNPNGVYSNSSYKVYTNKDDVYVASGGESGWLSLYNSEGISKYSNGEWTWLNRYSGISAMDSVIDIMDVAVDPRNQYIYAGSFGGGLLEIRPDKSTTVYKNNGFISNQIGNPGFTIISGLQFDSKQNLWMTNYSTTDQLIVKKADGSWQKFSLPSPGERTAAQLVIDNANQKWVVAPRGTGVFVYNDNNTIDIKSDDKVKLFTKGAGNGNLPSNEVLSIAKDKTGKIWIGTIDGIGIVNCPESVFSTRSCEAELKIVKYDLNAGLLFQREAINAIAVDGANNKWIGTNNGVWLISDDAEQIIHRFTKDNSPLPSNEIRSIAIQANSGDVFIGTSNGLVSYRGQATDGNPDNTALLVYPNPVPSGYTGTIAIKGLVENADVRITDVAGQLVYRTQAQGGQAVWDGKNYLGQRPRSGVYYVFVTNADGTETNVGKFIFNE